MIEVVLVCASCCHMALVKLTWRLTSRETTRLIRDGLALVTAIMHLYSPLLPVPK